MHDIMMSRIPQHSSLRDAIQCINRAATKIALVCTTEGTLVGTITDGDIRRALLQGASLDASITPYMNTRPVTAQHTDSMQKVKHVAQQHGVHHIPLLNDSGHVVDIKDTTEAPSLKDNSVLIMAGGLSKRLYPLTKNCPKPMLYLDDKPILEHIIERFASYGFCHFYLSVNYLAEQIQSYFNDGAQHGVKIDYINETQQLGTAGALSLLSPLSQPLIVINGDVLSDLNFEHLLHTHVHSDADVTLCVREYKTAIPFGVVNLTEGYVDSIFEKPVRVDFVSAGIYVFSPHTLAHVTKSAPIQMPDLINTLKQKNYRIKALPIYEYWRDIGQHDDFERAQHEFKQGVFS